MDGHQQPDGSRSYITVIPVDYSRGRAYAQQSPDYLDQYVDYTPDCARDDYMRGDYNINSEASFDKIGTLYAPPGYEREKTHSHGTVDRDTLEREMIDRDRLRDRTQHAQMGDVEWERSRERIQHRHIQLDRGERDRWQHAYMQPTAVDREREREREREKREKEQLEREHREREEEWERAAHLSNVAQAQAQGPLDSCVGVGVPGVKDGSTITTNEHLNEKALSQQLSTSSYRGAPLCVYLMSRVALHMELEDRETTTTAELMSAILEEEELGLPVTAGSLFSLWMCSGLLELQLKPHHKPFEIRRQWPLILNQYCNVSEMRIERDEPILSFQRNVFFPCREEEKIKDHKLLMLLYEEARYNILEGRYPCEVSHYLTLGGIQARIELGPYKPEEHTTQYFREHKDKFLPAHVRRTTWSWLPISGKNSPEVRLLDHYKRIPNNMSDKRLIRKYLEFCWSLPYYGSAFFQGQIEQPVRGLTSLITHQDVPVLVAINSHGVCVIDDVSCVVLLALKYDEMSWDFAKPSQENNLNCLPCLFLQFMVVENGARVSKILQVFSKQAVMMDSLISVFVQELKQKSVAAQFHDEPDRPVYDTSTDSDADTQIPLNMINRREVPQSCLSNKLSKLSLATFDEEDEEPASECMPLNSTNSTESVF